MYKRLVVIISLMLILTGCFNPKMNVLVSTPGYLVNHTKIEEVDNKITNSLNSFSYDLYNELYEDNENIFISPASIYLALSMTNNGASGITLEQITDTLKASDLSMEQLNELNRNLQSLILSYDDINTSLTNSIWIRDTYHDKVKKDFLNNNKEYYGALVSTLDFNDPKAKNTINNWVKKNTNELIEKVIEDEIDPLTVMFLINTIYFKADWKEQFEKENTSDKEFLSPNGKVEVPMMNKVDKLGYIVSEKIQGVLLPYKGDEVSMFIIMPEEGINNFFLDNNLLTLINDMREHVVDLNLFMPKVDIKYEASLKDPFINLGMTTPFTSNADFSNMAEGALEDGLHIADILHKSVLKIDEKGTEAAAVTSVEMRLESAPMYQHTMNINKPFILGIIDNKNDALLFLGGINNL